MDPEATADHHERPATPICGVWQGTVSMRDRHRLEEGTPPPLRPRMVMAVRVVRGVMAGTDTEATARRATVRRRLRTHTAEPHPRLQVGVMADMALREVSPSMVNVRGQS